jgi:integrase
MTLTEINSAPIGAVLQDDEIRGLELRVQKKRRTFYLYYRTRWGQRRRPKLGDFPSINLQRARAIARELLAKVALGDDPSGRWQNLRESETVNALIDRYLEDYSRPNKRTAWREAQQFEKKIRPRWGRKLAVDITFDDVMALRRAMSDKPITFNRIRALLAHMFNWAGFEPNPCRRVPRFREGQRRRYLAPEEYDRLAKALDEHEAQYPGPVAFLRLLMLLGCRSGELLRAQRAWLRNDILTLPEHKTSDRTGPKEIYFPPEAVAIVHKLEPRRGWLLGFQTRPTIAIDKIFEAAELADFVVHDLRHSYASEALSNGFTLDQIGELLGHTDVQTTRRYAHLVRAKKHAAANEIASHMSGMMRRRTKPANDPGSQMLKPRPLRDRKGEP